jgi:hypothetical protein
MDIGRDCVLPEPLAKIQFCLGQLEKAKDFENNLDWQSNIVNRCTIEEIIGALVAAEHEMVFWNMAGHHVVSP